MSLRKKIKVIHKGYSEGWRHCTLHISSDGKETYSDGDPSVREEFEELRRRNIEFGEAKDRIKRLEEELRDLKAEFREFEENTFI